MKPTNIVRVVSGQLKGKTGVVLRTRDESVCVILTKVWDHGIWFQPGELKVIGGTKGKK